MQEIGVEFDYVIVEGSRDGGDGEDRRTWNKLWNKSYQRVIDEK